jgi:predicted nucleic acid-binding protein
MILVDTSVWIDFFSSKPLPHVNLLEKLIHNDKDFVLIESQSKLKTYRVVN